MNGDRETERQRPLEAQLIENAPGLARLAAAMWWRATKWGLGASLRTASQLAQAAADPVLTAQVVNELGSELREYARDLLGITELDAQVRELTNSDRSASSNGSHNGTAPERVGLRAQGARLLRAAAQVDPAQHAHPAYVRILTELAPDEGRILRLLATDGAQPSIDVRAAGLIGVGAELVQGGLNMVGAHAGCQDRERMPAYLNNLERLGLIELSPEPIDDSVAYQVLQAQPEVMEALKRASRAKTVERSIRLTPFGEDFCAVCLPLDAADVQTLTADRPDPTADGGTAGGGP
jgi:abortive infection alpha-like protein